MDLHIAQVSFEKNNRKAMNRNWSNQKANPALKTKMENIQILQIDKILSRSLASVVIRPLSSSLC